MIDTCQKPLYLHLLSLSLDSRNNPSLVHHTDHRVSVGQPWECCKSDSVGERCAHLQRRWSLDTLRIVDLTSRWPKEDSLGD